MYKVNYNYIHSIEEIYSAIELLESIRVKYENKATSIRLSYGFDMSYQQDELLVECGRVIKKLNKDIAELNTLLSEYIMKG